MNVDVRRVGIHVFGRVHGVGFRYSTQASAADLEVMGWVRNCADGSVEILAEGAPESVEALVRWCRRGPRAARVDRVEVVDRGGGESLRGFVVRG